MNSWHVDGESPFGGAVVPPMLVSHFVLSVQFDHTKPFAIGTIHTFHESQIFEPIPVGATVRIHTKAIDLLEICAVSDGAAAVIPGSEAQARRLGAPWCRSPARRWPPGSSAIRRCASRPCR